MSKLNKTAEKFLEVLKEQNTIKDDSEEHIVRGFNKINKALKHKNREELFSIIGKIGDILVYYDCNNLTKKRLLSTYHLVVMQTTKVK